MKGSYIRVGDADLPMTDYELYSYEAFRKHLHDDERPIQRASLSTARWLVWTNHRGRAGTFPA